jgi:2-methylisocitrate lyase-like PEP mutase family enzyme
MTARPQDAATFHALHDDLLTLPNAWDVASAKVMELAGAKAIATTSAGLAWAFGYFDGHQLPFGKLVETIAAIARITALPISADAEGGYSDEPAQVGEHVAALIGAHELHLRKIEATRGASPRFSG